MEVEKRKKNKRVIREDMVQEEEEEEEESDIILKKSKREEEEEEAVAGAGGSSGVPTEEEVEEFFAILRRMKVAVKYFHQKGKVGGKEWREALEQAAEDITVDDGELGGVFDNKEKGAKVIINEGLDLNEVAPEASENDGA